MVWDAIEGINTKGTYPIISGRINDIAWDGDSQRIIAVGDGREMVSCNSLRKQHIGEVPVQGSYVSIVSSLLVNLMRPFSCFMNIQLCGAYWRG